MQFAAGKKEERQRRCHSTVPGEQDFPGAVAFRLRFFGVTGTFLELPDLRQIRRRLFLLVVLGPVHRHRHVRLPEAEPDFAHEDVFDLDGVLAGHGERRRFAGGEIAPASPSISRRDQPWWFGFGRRS